MLDRRRVLAALAAAACPLVRAGAGYSGVRRSRPAVVSRGRSHASSRPARQRAIWLYTLAPELLLGWPRAIRPEEQAYLLPEIATRPEVGRLTGRGNTANLEAVLASKPDLILDVGSTDATYVSLADRVQAQTGIAYALLDGRLDETAETYRMLGRLVRREADAAALAGYAEATLETVRERVAAVPPEKRPRTYYARGPRGLETGLAGSINVEALEIMGARNVADGQRGGLAAVSLEQVLAWDPEVIITIDQDFAAPSHRPELGGGVSRTGRPRPSLAQAALWLGRFPARGQPPRRALVAGQSALPGPVPGRPEADRARVLRPLLPRERHETSSSTTFWRAGADAGPRGSAACLSPSLCFSWSGCALAFAVGRFPVVASRLFGVSSGQADAAPPRPAAAGRNGGLADQRGPRVAAAVLVGVGAGGAPARPSRACSATRWSRPTSSACPPARRSAPCSASTFRSACSAIQALAFVGGLVAVGAVYAVGSALRGGDTSWCWC